MTEEDNIKLFRASVGLLYILIPTVALIFVFAVVFPFISERQTPMCS